MGSFRSRIAPRATGPFAISEEFGETKLQQRRGKIKQAFLDNAGVSHTNLTYLKEAYYFVPVHLALQLQARGQYIAALDWFRSVYDYSMPLKQRKIYYGLEAEESLAAGYERAKDWLLTRSIPTRSPRHVAISIPGSLCSRSSGACWSLPTPSSRAIRRESVPRARLLYLTALEMLDTPELKQTLGLCSDIIGNLEIQVSDPAWTPVWAAFARELSWYPRFQEIDRLGGPDQGDPEQWWESRGSVRHRKCLIRYSAGGAATTSQPG